MIKNMTKPKKILLIVVVIIVCIFAGVLMRKAEEKQKICNEISNYLSTEYGLEDIEIQFTDSNSYVWDYGVIVYSSNLDSLSYEKMTRIIYYLTSHTELENGDVNIERYICGGDSYLIFTNSVYKNGDCVYEYKTPPSSTITSADAPYVGMDTDFIGDTKLGSPDKTELCKDYKYLRPERQSITYKWYDSNGKLIFSAFTKNDEVVSIVDFRK